ncbi:microtubule-associated protein futsch-like [Cebidichthys violaceus]|uniref:microtubule-associated protein futsch-like n=1 Tax=Cebidichthys violaceus TaxID=271503 RepID=UPI0035CC5CB6
MAEEGCVYELEGLEKQLDSLSSRYSSDDIRADSKLFCSDFCELVEEYASRWQVPLPQLRILEIALRYFARASTFFTSNCDHVLHTLSSLALSVFELLLFFDQKDFHQEPLNHFTVTFQECHSALARHQNVHLLQVERLVRAGGPWAGPAFQAILSESSLPQSDVDGCVSSELPVFFELRVRYLLSCERVGEAMALARCCARHPTAGQHLFFLQVYLTWLFKTSQHDRLHKEVAEFNGKDAIHIICSLECEEKDELLLALSRAFLSQQLRRGDMYYLCDLVFIWSKLHSRLNTSKQALLEESHQLMLSATNVSSIFPFIRAILQELGEDGIQFCVELCANALGSCLPCDVITKSLIYKTIAGLLPNDLEVARACALLIFFLERTVETYKLVYLLYMHPDQDYHVEYSPIRNHVRFETLQVLKKDLYFDPEFWNLIALRTNCLKLMSEKGLSGDLEEIMEDKWIRSYCAKEPASRSSTSACQKGSKGAAAKKRHHKEDRRHDIDAGSKRLKVGPGKTRLHVDHTGKKKGSHGSSSPEPLRRSFWQLDRLQDNVAVGHGELRRTTRLSEKNPPKRRIRQPKWLLEDSGNLEENNVLPKMKKHGLKHQKHHGSNVVKGSESVELKHKPSVNSHLMARDSLKQATLPQVVLELSLPDNELLGTFSEDACNRHRGFPQVLLYRPTLKIPATSEPAKAVHRKEVILRARDAAMFAQQLHCYARRQKGKGVGPNIQGSVSTITRSSVHGSPPKDSERELCDRPAAEIKGGTAEAAEGTKSPALETVRQAQTTQAVSRKTFSEREPSEKSEVTEAPMLDKVLQAQTIASARELCVESAVEMKVTIASTATKVTPSPGLDKVSKAVKDAFKSTTSAEVSQTSPLVNNQMLVLDKIPPVSNMANISSVGAADPTPSPSQEPKSLSSQAETGKNPVAKADGPEVLTAVGNSLSEVDVTDVSPKFPKRHVPCENDTGGGTMGATATDQDNINDISALTLVTEMVTELAPEALARDLENRKQPAPEDGTSKEPTSGSKSKVPHKLRTTSSCSVVADVQGKAEGTQDFDPETPENGDLPESEESKLEYCCTFCSKVFKGSRVVEHAMFHYRKDECMFCGTMFKDDLLAMMHLSDHIEKLKRIKESDGNDVQETKDTSAKAKTTNVSSGRRSSGRPRKSTDCLKSTTLPHSTPSGSRQLRSNGKPVDEKTQNTSKHLHSKTPVHKVNGHIEKKKALDTPKMDTLTPEANPPLTQQETFDAAVHSRLQETQDTEMGSSAQVDRAASCSEKTQPLQVLNTAAKQSEKVEEKQVDPQEKVCCPVEGCGWFTDLSKKRVALLYHALEDHYGEVEPLEVAFRVGNGKCSSCMRVMWSFEHFQHHVERHRLSPRHPCLHLGCASRFKTGMEMRRHARRHSPLQAVCCVPGCPQLFICLWALNLHEREHYASKPTKADKNAEEPTKGENTPDGKKQPDHRPKDAAATVNTTESVKASRLLRGEATHNSSTERQAPLPSTVGASLSKEESKERNESKDSHVLKNLSNKDTSSQPAGPNLRRRQTLRKVTNATKSHKVISSSLLKQKVKARHKFKKKQVKGNTKGPKRRGRPAKSKEAVHDENTTSGQINQTVPEKSAELANPSKAAESSDVSNESKEEERVKGVVKTTETSIKSKSKKSMNKQMKNNHAKQKGVLHNTPTAIMTANSFNQSISATSADKTAKKLHKVKKRCTPKESQTASSDSSKSKKHKVTNGEANSKTVKKKCPLREPEARAGNPDSTPSGSGDSVPDVPATGLNERTAPPTASGEETQDKSKKSLVKTEGKKEKRAPSASSDSGKTKKKHEEINKDKKTLKGRPSDASKTFALKKKAKSESAHLQVEAEAAVESSPDATLSSVSAAAASGSKDATCPPAGENAQQAAKKEKPKKSLKNSDPNEASKKRKNVHKDGDAKIVKRRRKEKPEKSQTDVQPLAEVKAEMLSVGEEGKTPQPPISNAGYSVITNGQAAREDAKSTALRDTLAGYSSRPYTRPPPTAYLDEKYITMPKRRKEPSSHRSSQRSPPPQQACVAKTPQRQRCANCFATFNSAEDLQSHLQLQKCSSLFGFDSDDEGNGFMPNKVKVN